MSKVYTINTGNKAQFLSEYALLSGSRITGSLFGTASWAQSSSVATSASFAPIGPGTTNRIALFNSTNTVSSSLIVQSGDSIGVNTSSPTNFGAGYTTLAVNNTTAGVLELMSNGVSQFRIFGNGTENRLHGVTSAAMTFYTNNSERVRIDTSGNVGIGTTSPTAKLQISGASDSYIIDAHSGAFGGRAVLMPGRFFIGTLSSGYPEIGYNFNAFNSVYTKLADDTAWKITFGGSNRMDFANVGTGTGTFSWTTRMSILSASGNVGIGTTNPADLLHVYKTTNDAQVRAETAGAGAYFYAKSATDGYAGLVMVGAGSEKFFIGSYGNDAIQFMRGRSGNEFMRITSAGDVGIGTTSNFDGSKLDVRSGKIVAGTDSSTAGSVTIQNYYTGGALSLWGSMYSSGGPLMGYGVKSSTGSANSFLSATGISISRGAYIIEGNIHRWYNGANQSVAIDSPVTMTERMIMDANGNVGIGTTNPTGKLHVQGASLYLSTTDDWAASTGSGLVIARGAATGNTYSSIYGVQSGGGSYANLVVPGGNVGIGTTDPGTKLDVIGTSRARTLYAQGVSGDSGNIIIQSGSSNAFWISGKSNAGGAGTLHIGANGPTEPTAGVIVINTSNNVGIGTTNFSAKLQVSGSVVATAYNEPTTLGAVLAADGTNALLYARNGSTSWAPMFIDATTLYLNAQSSGNVGIGTTSPSNRLQIQGNVSASSYTSSINNAVGFLGTASRAVSASRADSAALVDVLSGGSTTGLGIYSGSFFGTSSWATTASFALNAGGATAGFPFSGSAVITGSLLVSSSGITLIGTGLTGSVFGTSSWANSASVALTASVVTTNTVSYTAGAGLSGGGTATLGGSSVTIDAVAGAGISLTAPTNDAININTGSTHFTDGVKTKLNTEGVFSSSAQVNHNTTTNYVANQHIDHTSVSISAGNGLTGGGTIAASRTLTVRYVPSTDDRATNSPPASSSAGLYADFKTNTTDGLIDGGTYHGVLTFRPYGTTSDFSGGPAHQLGFTERGGLYLRTGSSNSWGPWGRLAYQTGSILGTASFATSASFAPVGPGTVNSIALFNASTTISSSNIFQSSNNIGIGTVSPTQRLDVSGSIAIAGTAIVNTSRNLINLGSLSNDANTGFFNIIDSGKQIQLTDGTRDLRINSTFGGSNAAIGTVGSHDLNLFTANSFRVTIKSDGNVGIGTTNPGYKLDVYNPGNLAQFLSNDGTFNPRLQISGSSEGIHIYQTYSTAADSLVLGTGGAERMRIKGSNVGIGTATPAYPLQVRRAGGAGSLGISIDNVGSTDRTVQYFAVQDSAAGLGAGHAWYYRPPSSTTDTFGMILDENGNVGIGLTTPGQALSVSGSRIAVDGETLLIGRVFTDNNYIGLKTSYQTSGDFMILSGKIDGNTYLSARSGGNVVVRGGGNSSTAELNITPSVAYFNGNLGVGTAAPGSNRLQVQGNVSASSYTSSINNAVGFFGTASRAVSSSRADSSALIDVLSGGSTTGLGIYSGSFSGSFFGSLSGGGSGAGFPYSGSAVITGSLLISGSGLQVTGSTTTSGSILPAGDNMFDLGSSARRWANLYTGDLVLSNEGSSGNNVDGTTGNWTVQEGDAHLYIINNKSGKKYKFVLEEIE